MGTRITAVVNCDDAVVFWCIDEPIDDCLGFALERERKLPDGNVERKTLDNRAGFAKDAPALGETRPSSLWPFQRFWWADHSANTGDRVRYRVVPMVAREGELNRVASLQSPWTPWLVLDAAVGDGISAYFNRGLVISQFMARYLERLRRELGLPDRKAALAEFKRSLDDHEAPIRAFLSGELRLRMLSLLKEARRKKWQVYGALYELADEELIEGLQGLGKRAHIVLANGSIQARKGETSAQARKRDQNKTARKALRDAHVEVFDRFVSPGALGHNKFLVFASATGKPQSSWTGSTNWTKTGLCTQVNNGLFVRDAALATHYLEQWERLRDAGSGFPKSLIDANGTPKRARLGGTSAELWFTRAPKRVDLAALDEIVSDARDGVLFLMFQPGNGGTLSTMRELLERPKGRYLKGVVSTLPAGEEHAEERVDVTVFSEGNRHRVDLGIVQPTGVLHPFANWAATVTRGEFLGNVGNAIVHSKLIVVDPFTRPVVVTGSHNFSTNASTRNDENFVVLKGNGALAQSFAVHILSVYHHYRWLAHVAEKQRKNAEPTGFLRDDDSWQAWQLRGEARKELDFWLRQ